MPWVYLSTIAAFPSLRAMELWSMQRTSSLPPAVAADTARRLFAHLWDGNQRARCLLAGSGIRYKPEGPALGCFIIHIHLECGIPYECCPDGGYIRATNPRLGSANNLKLDALA
ncbi:uncharacterized protein PG986_006449 [Apiospora aurea]|uniref:Uncharacterized protein n=1 Tax=Apiospora aurea TaxID=335848 RepID=A0ABR1QKF9_9PEZI